MKRQSTLGLLAVATAMIVSACTDGPTTPQSNAPTSLDLALAAGAQSVGPTTTDSSLAKAGGNRSQRTAAPTIAFLNGACADAPSIQGPDHANIQGTGFTPNSEVPLVMADNTNGFLLRGQICNGSTLDIGEPFVLPPTWAIADGSGNFTAVVTGMKCLVQALDIPTCTASNVLSLPPVP